MRKENTRRERGGRGGEGEGGGPDRRAKHVFRTNSEKTACQWCVRREEKNAKKKQPDGGLVIIRNESIKVKSDLVKTPARVVDQKKNAREATGTKGQGRKTTFRPEVELSANVQKKRKKKEFCSTVGQEECVGGEKKESPREGKMADGPKSGSFIPTESNNKNTRKTATPSRRKTGAGGGGGGLKVRQERRGKSSSMGA